jgi:hypothetical protein
MSRELDKYRTPYNNELQGGVDVDGKGAKIEKSKDEVCEILSKFPEEENRH